MKACCKRSACFFDPSQTDQSCCWFCVSHSDCSTESPEVACEHNPKTCGHLVMEPEVA